MLSVLGFLCAFLLSSCNEGPNAVAVAETAEQQEADHSIEKDNALLKAYFNIKDALVKSEAESAGTYASELLNNPEVKDEAGEAALTALKEIAGTSDLAEQRKAFEALSIAIYDYLKKSGHEGATIYKQYCPMAFNNEGAYWLSLEEDIRNPYFGDRMLRCGRVQEEL